MVRSEGNDYDDRCGGESSFELVYEAAGVEERRPVVLYPPIAQSYNTSRVFESLGLEQLDCTISSALPLQQRRDLPYAPPYPKAYLSGISDHHNRCAGSLDWLYCLAETRG